MNEKYNSDDFQKIWDSISEDDCAARRKEAIKNFNVFTSRLATRQSRSKYVGVFAVLFAISATLLSLELFNRKDTERLLADVTWTTNEVPAGTTQVLDLPDGSRVTLNGGSQLVFPSSFGSFERDVFFSGEAYFEISPDSEHPFIVNTPNATVKVLGTEFNLRSYRNDSLVDLALFKGLVNFQFVNNNGEKVSHAVHQGEHISFDVRSKSINSNYFTIDEFTSWRNGKYFFKDETLENIAKQLERIYNVRFIITNDCLKDLTYHIAIDCNNRIDDAISLLNMDPRISATIKGSDIYISSKR